MPAWYELLWQNFPFALTVFGIGMVLLLWRAVMRFGPILPDPNFERRSLLEHIDASGRWLWLMPGGPEVLLAASRASLRQLLQRRAPELQGLSIDEQLERLAEKTKMDVASLRSAWMEGVARHPQEFTLQIKTLQQLRTHYER